MTELQASNPTNDLIFLDPVFHNKIWGGRRLEKEFGYAIPDGAVGECWAISAHPAGDCVVREGAYKGKYLSELWEHEPQLFEGAPGDRFPLLIKIIDADGDLSIQVHPDDAYAKEHENGSLGKSECWYVLAAEEGATIVVGQKARSREEFEASVNKGAWSELLNEIPIHAGDFFQINPGTVHAIKAGTLILETQQSSDITYRVYDYDRVQDDGTKRELHLEKSLDVIDYDASAPSSGEVTQEEKDGVTHLVENECYAVDRVVVNGALRRNEPWPFECVSVISGSGSAAGHPVRKGDHFIVPAHFGPLDLDGDMTIICSHLPVSM